MLFKLNDKSLIYLRPYETTMGKSGLREITFGSWEIFSYYLLSKELMTIRPVLTGT